MSPLGMTWNPGTGKPTAAVSVGTDGRIDRFRSWWHEREAAVDEERRQAWPVTSRSTL